MTTVCGPGARSPILKSAVHADCGSHRFRSDPQLGGSRADSAASHLEELRRFAAGANGERNLTPLVARHQLDDVITCCQFDGDRRHAPGRAINDDSDAGRASGDGERTG